MTRTTDRNFKVAALASLLIACAIGLASIVPVSAQAPYPSHPIRVVVPFGPGGFADITVRLLGQKLTERTGAQVVIENRPGAGGIVAANSVIASAPDGYTLFVFSSGIALSKSLLKSMPFDPATAFAPISTMAQFDLLVLVEAKSPLRTLKQAFDAARADPRARFFEQSDRGVYVRMAVLQWIVRHPIVTPARAP